MSMTRSKLLLLAGMTTSLLVLRCGSENGSPFTDAGGRAGSGASGSAGQGATSGTGGSVAGSGGAAGAAMECTPDTARTCTGEDDCEGTQLCLADGSGFSPCECETGGGGEGGAKAAGGAGSGTGGAADGGVSGQGEGTGGVNVEAGSAGHAPGGGGGAGGDAGAGGDTAGGVGGIGGVGGVGDTGGAAGVTSGGEGGMGETGPVTIELTNLVDTFIEECNRNVSHGSDDHVSVDTDPCEYQAYIGPAEPLAIPAGSVVDAATLRVECDNAGVAVEVYAVEEVWDEATLDWNARPELGALLGSFTPDVGVIEIDLTNLVQAWVDAGTAFGVAFVQTTGTNGSDYWSTEAAAAEQRPRLSITYSP